MVTQQWEGLCGLARGGRGFGVLLSSQCGTICLPASRAQNMTSGNFGGNSYSVSDILETARGKSETEIRYLCVSDHCPLPVCRIAD